MYLVNHQWEWHLSISVGILLVAHVSLPSTQPEVWLCPGASLHQWPSKVQQQSLSSTNLTSQRVAWDK
jgi:hypothetical protein